MRKVIALWLLISSLFVSSPGATGLDFDINVPANSSTVSSLPGTIRETRRDTYNFGVEEHTTTGKHKLPITTTAELNTNMPSFGRLIYNSTTGALLFGNGSAWVGTNGAVNVPFATIGNYSNNLTTAVATIGSTPTRLVIDSTAVLSASTVVPKTLTLEFMGAGKVTLGAYNLTLNCEVRGPPTKIFDYTGAGVVIRGADGQNAVLADWFGALGDGSNDYAAIVAAYTYHQSYVGAVGFVNKTYSSTGYAVTIPANITLSFQGGAKLSLLNHSYTINGAFDAPLSQCFVYTGSGVVLRGPTGPSTCYPEWFGVGFTGVTGANNYLFNESGDILLTSGTYPVTADIAFTKARLCFRGDSKLVVSNGITATLSTIEAPQRQVLTLTGTGKVVGLTVANAAWWETFAKAITALDTLLSDLTLPAGTYVAGGVTVPSTVALHPELGANFTIASGTTFTINGPFLAGRYQVFTCSGTGRVLLTGGKVPEINALWWGTNRNAIQAAIDAYTTADPGYQTTIPKILIPAGEWDITSCLDATNRYDIWLSGEASGAQFLRGTILRGNSGAGKAVIDFTGTRVRLEEISIASTGAANPSTIGILMGASNTFAPVGNLFRNVAINMESEITANNNLGTVGVINDCAENTTYNRFYSSANLPLIITVEHTLSWISGHTFTVSSEYTTLGSTQHNGVHDFYGSMLIAFNSYRPGIAIWGQGVNLGNTFIGAHIATGATGAYNKGILCRNVKGLHFTGELEYFNTALDIKGGISNFDIKTLMTPISGTAELITADTSDVLANGKCSIELPDAEISTLRKFIDATVTTGAAWGGAIYNCDFSTNMAAGAQSILVGEAIANKWVSGNLIWAGGKAEFAANAGGTVIKTAFGINLGTFSDPAGLDLLGQIFTIVKPATEATNHKAGTISCRLSGHITTGGNDATEITGFPFEAYFTIAEKADGTLYLSNLISPGFAKADLVTTVPANSPAASSANVAVVLNYVALVKPDANTVQVKLSTTGSGASINGKACLAVGTAEFYLTGYNTRQPNIYPY